MNRHAYDSIAAEWDAERSSLSGRERTWLDAGLDGLAPASRVLDLGCGTGRPIAEYVAARRHRIVGVDQALALLARARARLPQHDWIACRLEDFAFRGGWAAVVCWDALFHVARAHHEPILAGVARSLRPGGRLVLTAGGSDQPPFTDRMLGRRFFYDSHPPERVLSILRGLGLTIVAHDLIDRPTGGREKGRLAVVAEKPRP
jgi:SAM-dependent methyltransferase